MEGNSEGGRSTARQGKVALKQRTQSPGRYLLLSPNDDGLERRQARLARAQKRKSLVFGEADAEGGAPDPRGEQILTQTQLLDLFNNCIKLAAENKINQHNTWDLKLIDYLTHIVKADANEDTQTNFQKASCTLEASAKIYSCRVDSVHTETYKVLGGLNRSAAPTKEKDVPDVGEACENGGEEHHRKKDTHKSTLESCESLNVKHFDGTVFLSFSISFRVSFAAVINVDPLFHQTSAQFDEGGAKGLLLNTLSVYRGCEILFDSYDIPEKCMQVDLPKDPITIDLSFAADEIEQMRSIKDTEISPSLAEILELLDDPLRKAAIADAGFSTVEAENLKNDVQDDGFGSPQSTIDVEPADGFGNNDGYVSEASTVSNAPQEDGVENISDDPDDTVEWLMGLPTRKNSWAGADYWKFAKPKGEPVKKQRTKKKTFSIVYTCAPEFDVALFAKPHTLKQNLLPLSKRSANTTLPEDLCYQVGDLSQFPLRRSQRNARGRSKQNDFDETRNNPLQTWIDDDDFAGDQECHSGIEDNADELVDQPRKVQKIEVNYEKTAKQVDVRALKETLWEQLQQEAASDDVQMGSKDGVDGIRFSEMLHKIPGNGSKVAADPKDLSVHLCFICLLHLANEHGLVINGCAAMNELRVKNVNL